MNVTLFYGRKSNNENVSDHDENNAVENCHPDFICMKQTKNSLLSCRNSLKTFTKLSSAFEYVENAESDMIRVFSREKHIKNDNNESKSTYEFVVSTLESFFEHYFSLEPGKRHYYEVIPYNTPCRLYFDLEFLKNDNPHITDGDKIVTLFIEYICKELLRYYGLQCSIDKIVWLDSSDDRKYSCHLIFHIHENTYFINNSQVGCFVKQCYSNVIDHWAGCSCGYKLYLTSNERLNSCKNFCSVCLLMVISIKKTPTFLADLSVYSRNRSFRLFLSRKMGSDRILTISKQQLLSYFNIVRTSYRPYSASFEKSDHYKWLQHSLVVPYGFTPRKALLLQGLGHILNPISNVPNTGSHHFAMNDISTNESNKKYIFLVFSDVSAKPTTARDTNVATHERERETNFNSQNRSEIIFNENLIDQQVIRYLNNVSKGKGFIRKKILFCCSMTYEIGGYRFCHKINREHKSNHIYYMACMKDECFYVVQKCHDIECGNFVSEPLFSVKSVVNPCDLTNVSNISSQTSFQLEKSIVPSNFQYDDLDLSNEDFNQLLELI